VHTSSPPSTSPTLGPGSPNGPKQLEGSLYSWVSLKSLKRAIVVFYNPDDAERARQASDRYYFPPTASTPEITLRAFRGAHTVLVPVQLSGPPPDRFYDVDSDDESAIFESPFHLRPPVPERNLLISPPGSPPVGWEQTHEEPPNEVPLAVDLQRALEQLRAKREQEDWEREATGASGDMSENEDGILLIPRTRLVFVCGCRTGVIAVALSRHVTPSTGTRLMRIWAMATGSCPAMHLLFGLRGVWDSSLLPRVCRLSYTHLLLVQMDMAEG